MDVRAVSRLSSSLQSANLTKSAEIRRQLNFEMATLVLIKPSALQNPQMRVSQKESYLHSPPANTRPQNTNYEATVRVCVLKTSARKTTSPQEQLRG